MAIFTERQKNRHLLNLPSAAALAVYFKLRDTLILQEWGDLLLDAIYIFTAISIAHWFWYSVLGADKRAEERQREQERKAAASLDGASSSGGLGSTRSQNSPDNL